MGQLRRSFLAGLLRSQKQETNLLIHVDSYGEDPRKGGAGVRGGFSHRVGMERY